MQAAEADLHARPFSAGILMVYCFHHHAHPAQIEDAKTAVRFMRMHAREYGVDAERIALWGDSSGGHTAVMAGVTADGTLDLVIDFLDRKLIPPHAVRQDQF